MNEVIALGTINWWQSLINVMTFLVALLFVIGLIEKICQKFGIEFKPKREENERKETLKKMQEQIDAIGKQNEALVKKIDKLDEMFIDDKVDRLRYTILDFASDVSSGRRCSKEQWDRVIALHTKYEKILKDNGMTNGQVDNSMDVINHMYKEKLEKNEW